MALCFDEIALGCPKVEFNCALCGTRLFIASLIFIIITHFSLFSLFILILKKNFSPDCWWWCNKHIKVNVFFFFRGRRKSIGFCRHPMNHDTMEKLMSQRDESFCFLLNLAYHNFGWHTKSEKMIYPTGLTLVLVYSLNWCCNLTAHKREKKVVTEQEMTILCNKSFSFFVWQRV